MTSIARPTCGFVSGPRTRPVLCYLHRQAQGIKKSDDSYAVPFYVSQFGFYRGPEAEKTDKDCRRLFNAGGKWK